MQNNLVKTIEYLNIPRGTPLAVACSGGADSMALALLAAQWCQQSGSALTALTVNHGLRPEAAQEARQVQQWLKKRGIAHVTLAWQGDKPTRNIQEAARNARYALMAEYCRTHGIAHLLVAHTQDDQAETFLLRLARGSGVDGLACMQPVSSLYGITLLRPLLDVPKSALRDYLHHEKQPHIEDPSNQNTAYARVRMRNSMPALEALGLTVPCLAATATRMARARAALEADTQQIMVQSCEFFPEGYALLRPFTAPEEITLRVLASLIMTIGGHEMRPRLEDITRLHAAWQHHPFKGVTLGGCQCIPHKGAMLICREPRAVASPIPAGNEVWDNRFHITCRPRKGWNIGALTQQGWLALAKTHGLTNPFPDKRILYSLPALRDAEDTIRAVPHLGVGEERIVFCAEFKAAPQSPDIFPADR